MSAGTRISPIVSRSMRKAGVMADLLAISAGRAPVMLAHLLHSVAGGNHLKILFREQFANLAHPRGRMPAVVFHPLAEHGGEPRRHACCAGAGLQPSDRSEPRGNGL